jgi:sugar fermentation stimulation protein A
LRFLSPLIPARFIERPNRFIASVELDSGKAVWAHVPNTGALRGLKETGQEVLLTQDGRPGRKTQYTWRFVKGPNGWVCIDTLAPNRLVAAALAGDGLPGIPKPLRVRPEVTLPQGGRLDFALDLGGNTAFLEVKSVTWVEDGVALFPDGVTARGRRHLQDLAGLVRQGHAAWQVFVVQREDARVLKAAAALDPDYAWELALANEHGVKILVIQEKVAPPEINLASTLPFDLSSSPGNEPLIKSSEHRIPLE